MQEIVEQQAERGLLAKDEKIAACSHIFEEEGARFVKAMIYLTNSTEEAGHRVGFIACLRTGSARIVFSQAQMPYRILCNGTFQ